MFKGYVLSLLLPQLGMKHVVSIKMGYPYPLLTVIRYYDQSVLSSVHFSSVTQSCLTLCDPMNHSTPGLPVHHQLPEFT